MEVYIPKNIKALSEKRVNPVIPIIALWGFVMLIAFTFFAFENGLSESLQSLYMLPWAFVVGMIVLAPSVYLAYKGKFDFFHPLVFAAWTYIFPAFVCGGIIISFGWVSPYFLSYIEDPHYNLPLTLVYIGIGFLSLTIGFALPAGKYIGKKIDKMLPRWQWKPSEVWIPGLILMVIGITINIIGFVQGIMGFQRVTDISIFDGLLYFFVVILLEGNVLIWLAIFQTKQKTGVYYIFLILMLLFLPLRMAILGSRSSLLVSVFPIALAFQYSGRKLKWQYGVLFAAILFVSVCIGVVYGSSFRNIKGSESRINAGDYFGQVAATIDYISSEDPLVLLEYNAQSLADRVENLSSVAVVVANYEKLAPYEASYGLENNIVNDALTSFVPRFLWPDKPNTSDPRAYSDLYFNYGDNSFAISPFGDLLRNFGGGGVVAGMLLLGIYLRSIYVALIDTPHKAMWKTVAYFSLLTLVSYEAFYATIFPSIIRTLFVLIVSLFAVNLIVRGSRSWR